MTKTIYDYPLYYDILFGWDRSAEACFYDRIMELGGLDGDDSVLEVACGTGRIAIQLARLGRSVTGLDISDDMLAYLRAQAVAEGVTVRTICEDMATFSGQAEYGAAYNPMSSFRLLHDDVEAGSHLNAMARSIRPGGIYVLDMEFRDRIDDPPVTTDEAWEMKRGGVTVKATDEMIYINDNGRELETTWGAESHLRTYTCEAFSDRVAMTKSFEIESWHPEVGRAGEDGASVFDAELPVASCSPGRAMVVLRRI